MLWSLRNKELVALHVPVCLSVCPSVPLYVCK